MRASPLASSGVLRRLDDGVAGMPRSLIAADGSGAGRDQGPANVHPGGGLGGGIRR